MYLGFRYHEKKPIADYFYILSLCIIYLCTCICFFLLNRMNDFDCLIRAFLASLV